MNCRVISMWGGGLVLGGWAWGIGFLISWLGGQVHKDQGFQLMVLAALGKMNCGVVCEVCRLL